MKNASYIASLLLVAVALLFAGCSPLLSAAYEGDTKEMERLIAEGADVNEASYGGRITALHWAAEKGHAGAVRLLIEKGADVNASNSSGYTALDWAALNGHAKIVRLLLEKGADAGRALQLAEKRGHTAVVNILEKAEDDAAARKSGGQAPLAVARPGQSEETLAPVVKSDVDEPPVSKARPNKNAYAIVIGIETYRQKLPKADFANHDAQVMTNYLTKTMGFPEENVVTLINDRALKSDFEKYFEKWLPNNVEKDGTVFVYYSGHGSPNPKTGDAFLVPYDGDPSFINETGYSLKRLYEALEKLQAKEIVVALDSCFSGAGGRSVLAKGARPLVISLEGPFVGSRKMTVFSAASGDQVSSTYDEKGHGLFTYFMLDGLKGKADADGDGKIDSTELFEYVRPRVERVARKQYNNEQSPQLVSQGKERVFLMGR